MKNIKFWMAGTLFVSLVAATAVNLHLVYPAADGNNFILSNTEALAQGESEEGMCSGSGSLSCGGGQYKVRI